MSEFTDGVLFLARDTDSLRQAAQDLSPAYPILSLNEKWEALFPDRNVVKTTALLYWLQTSSQRLPLMDFHNAEDTGWSYRLFKDGIEAASLDVNYDLDWNMMVAIFEKRHPEVDFYGSINPKILEETATINQEVRNSRLFREKVAKQYQRKNLSEFSVFNVEPAVLAELDGILTPDGYLETDSMFAQVTHFKRLLGLPEMRWLSYHYLTQTDWGQSKLNS